jgi:hypothetical protein
VQKLFLIFSLLVFTPSLVNAALLGLDIASDGTESNDFRDLTLGWKFSLSEDVALTALGTWDQDANGLNQDQKVSIWRINGELLTSVMIDNTAAAVSSASEQGRWLFVDIANIFLSAGEYLIGADRHENSGDAFQMGDTGIATESRLTWVEARYAGLDRFGIPEQTVSGTQYFGPNLMIKSVSVPEPGTLGILSVSLVGFWMARGRKA